MTAQEKMLLLEDLFEADEGTLKPDMELDAIEDWASSMTKMALIVMLNDECGKTLKVDDIKNFRTLRDIMDFMG